MTKSIKRLSEQQLFDAKQHEKVIDDALSSYVEIGLSLREIQQKQLHAGRFIDYAMDRFGLKSHTIYRYMRAAEVAKNLMDANLPQPKNIGQAHRVHELFSDDLEEQLEFWRRLVEVGVPIALSSINKAFDERQATTRGELDTTQDYIGDIDMNSCHQVAPIHKDCIEEGHGKPVAPSTIEGNLNGSLKRAKAELEAVYEVLQRDKNSFDALEGEIAELALLISKIQHLDGSLTVAA